MRPHIGRTSSSHLNALKQTSLCPLCKARLRGVEAPSALLCAHRGSRVPGNQHTRTVTRFGPFEADLQTQELRKQGARLRLPGQSFQILKMLLERPGELVTREELRTTLWPSDTFVDFEHGLNAGVNRLREALGDSADSPRLVETLPRRGYPPVEYCLAPVRGCQLHPTTIRARNRRSSTRFP
jgi:DNA-binding winged helix-turn-helix (wHTH) protein